MYLAPLVIVSFTAEYSVDEKTVTPIADTEVMWHPTGHETVAAIAMAMVAPKVRRCAEAMVGDVPLAAAWPDDAKKTPEYHWSKSLHYTNTPPWATNYVESDCHKGKCVVSAITNYTHRLEDATLPNKEHNIALKFLMHFVGDIHQPLHAGFKEDYGGNKIKGTFLGEDMSLHGVWDKGVINRRLAKDFPEGKTAWQKHLADRVKDMSKEKVDAWQTCGNDLDSCSTQWVKESQHLAVKVAYVDGDGKPVPQKFVMTEADYTRLLPVVESQIIKGGVRLALLLNKQLSKCPHTGDTKVAKYMWSEAVQEAPVEELEEAVDSDSSQVQKFTAAPDQTVPEPLK